MFYNDLPQNEADAWASKLTHQSAGVYTSIQTYAAWRHIPSTYVAGGMDKTTCGLKTVERIMKESPQTHATAFDRIDMCDGGHCLMISRAPWLAELLRRAVGEDIP